MPQNAKKLSTSVENPVENNFSESVENFIVILYQYGIIDMMPVGIHYQWEETTTMTAQEFNRFFEAVAIALFREANNISDDDIRRVKK